MYVKELINELVLKQILAGGMNMDLTSNMSKEWLSNNTNDISENETTDYEEYQIDVELLEKYYKNRAISDTAYWALIVSYSILIFVGSIGNFFVILAIINNKGKSILYAT